MFLQLRRSNPFPKCLKQMEGLGPDGFLFRLFGSRRGYFKSGDTDEVRYQWRGSGWWLFSLSVEQDLSDIA